MGKIMGKSAIKSISMAIFKGFLYSQRLLRTDLAR